MTFSIRLMNTEWGPITHYALRAWKYESGKMEVWLDRCYQTGGSTLAPSDRPEVYFKIQGSDLNTLAAMPSVASPSGFLNDAAWFICNFLVNNGFVSGVAEVIGNV